MLYWTKAMKICGVKGVYGSPALQPVIQKERVETGSFAPSPLNSPMKAKPALIVQRKHLWKISIMRHAIDLAYPQFEMWITDRAAKGSIGGSGV